MDYKPRHALREPYSLFEDTTIVRYLVHREVRYRQAVGIPSGAHRKGN